MADDTPKWRPLNATTVNALGLIAGGHTMRSAAPALNLTVEQVTYHVRCGLALWKVSGRTGLMHRACERGAVALDRHPLVEPRRKLTPFETLVLRHLAEDRTYCGTATLVNQSRHAVQVAVKGILFTLRAGHTAQAVYRAHQLDLLNPAAVAKALIPAPKWRPLPNVVVEVVRLVAQGMTNAEMANALGLTCDHVKDRLKQAHALWQTRNRAHLVHLAHERGVFPRGATTPGPTVLEARRAD